MTLTNPRSAFRRKSIRVVAIALIASVIAGSIAGMAIAAALNL